MTARKRLFFHEEIMLLALRDKKGTIVSGSTFPYAVGGAILAELLVRERIKVDDTKKKLVTLLSADTLRDPVLDECLAKMKKAKKRASVKTWVTRFARVKKLKQRVAEGLCKQGIIREDQDKVLLIFNRTIYPQVNPIPERELIARMRNAIFTQTNEVDSRTAIIVSIANGAGLLKVPFDKKKLKSRKERLKKIAEGEVAGKATREAIEAMQAAVAAIAAASVVVTTAGN